MHVLQYVIDYYIPLLPLHVFSHHCKYDANEYFKQTSNHFFVTLAVYYDHQDLGLNRSQTKDILADLRKNLWIQRATRAVFIDFTVYNANINLFCVIK